MKRTVVILSACLLTACTTEAPNAPICRIQEQHLEASEGNAGCIIRVGQRLLTIRHRYSGGLDVPGGTAQEGESAQCTAHRETWEETGFNVEVGEYLGETQLGLRLYSCQMDDDFGGELLQFPVPDWADAEVKSLQLTDPFSTTHKDWRFPDQLVSLREYFVAAGNAEKQPGK